MVETTTAICQECGERFVLNRRQGRNSGRRRPGRSKASRMCARYCSNRCRQAAYRKRIRRNARATEIGPQKGGGRSALSAVTPPLEATEIAKEFSVENTDLGRSKYGFTIVPDARWRGSCRIRRPDGTLTDIVNLTRARDALQQLKIDPEIAEAA
jgi:hypothetical protein